MLTEFDSEFDNALAAKPLLFDLRVRANQDADLQTLIKQAQELAKRFNIESVTFFFDNKDYRVYQDGTTDIFNIFPVEV
jgi:hypothetical protein